LELLAQVQLFMFSKRRNKSENVVATKSAATDLRLKAEIYDICK
jgi:hypothetical protein